MRSKLSAIAGLLLVSFFLSLSRSFSQSEAENRDLKQSIVKRLAANHATAHSGDKSLVVWISIFSDESSLSQISYSINSQGLIKRSILGPGRGSGKEDVQLDPKQLDELQTILQALPSSQPLKTDVRFMISFLDHGKWTTRNYSEVPPHSTLEKLANLLGTEPYRFF